MPMLALFLGLICLVGCRSLSLGQRRQCLHTNGWFSIKQRKVWQNEKNQELLASSRLCCQVNKKLVIKKCRLKGNLVQHNMLLRPLREQC